MSAPNPEGYFSETDVKIRAVNDDTRRVILGLLKLKGPLFQRDLAKALNLTSSLIAYHLNILLDSGLVQKKYIRERKKKAFSQYAITGAGTDLLVALGLSSALTSNAIDEIVNETRQIHPNSIEILDSYLSPIVLPREVAFGWVKWNLQFVPEKIELEAPKAFRFIRFLNVRVPADAEKRLMEKTTSSFAVMKNELLSNGFLGFEAMYDSLPESDTPVDVRIGFAGETLDLHQSITISTRIVRPLLEIKMSPRNLTIDGREGLDMEVKTQNLSVAEALEVRSDLVTKSVPDNILEIIRGRPTILLVNPATNIQISDYPSKIVIKKAGIATLRFILRYKDRVGNSYVSESQEVRLQSARPRQSEVEIKNVVKGETTSVLIPAQLAIPHGEKK